MSISGHRTRAAFGRYIIASEKGLCEAVIKTSTYVESLTPKPESRFCRSYIPAVSFEEGEVTNLENSDISRRVRTISSR